jgi:bifunctional UDP-N-acetylglucosamine pyrophosphorylase/glucosamine-1-phosphate N-acetyltransferase
MPAERRPRTAVVLAAGQGTRMRSSRPKVLHRAAGRPLLAWVLDAARAAGCGELVVVVGHGADEVRRAVAAPDVSFAVQAEQRGTGHALAQAASAVAGDATLLVLSGDVPLVRPATLVALAEAAEAPGGWGALAAAEHERPAALGRVLTAPDGGFERIVEAKDATPAELALGLVNAGLYAFPAPGIFTFLDRLRPDNAQGEIYLTDAPRLAADAGHRIAVVSLDDPAEAIGVNTRGELARVHRVLLDRHLEKLMESGVSVLEPARTSVEPTVEVAPDAVLHPGVALLGVTRVGAGAVLHQGAWARDTEIGPRAEVGPYAVLDGARVAAGARVAPLHRHTGATAGDDDADRG